MPWWDAMKPRRAYQRWASTRRLSVVSWTSAQPRRRASSTAQVIMAAPRPLARWPDPTRTASICARSAPRRARPGRKLSGIVAITSPSATATSSRCAGSASIASNARRYGFGDRLTQHRRGATDREFGMYLHARRLPHPRLRLCGGRRRSTPIFPATCGRTPADSDAARCRSKLPRHTVADAVEMGAAVAEHQPQDGVRVFLDPAGHPLCSTSVGSRRDPAGSSQSTGGDGLKELPEFGAARCLSSGRERRSWKSPT